MFFFAACSDSRPLVERAETLKAGDTIERVIEVMGEPNTRFEHEGVTMWFYRTGSAARQPPEVIQVIIRDGRFEGWRSTGPIETPLKQGFKK